MATLSAWYNSQYATWNRTRRLHTPPFLARTETTTSRTATAMAARSQGASPPNTSDKEKEKKKQDALFGPNIGVVSSGPAWTDIKDKKVVTDELTPEVVKGWISKSKESTQPTTTLQALVNLKRPTLRLSPLSPTEDSTNTDSHDHHGLEFEFDCDAPKCGIYVHVLLSPDHPHAEPTTAPRSRILVFETVVDGGFGKLLSLEEGATLELGRFEYSTPSSASPDVVAQASQQPEADTASNHTSATTATTPGQPDRRRRFTSFYFRKRMQDRSVSGPALAVVDAEVASSAKGKESTKEAEEGVKVTIRLAALDEQGTELASPNEQVTYLHVVRFGAPLPEGEEDNRPWVVKVVKREATIGPHTFHLHEIYGLSSAPSHPVAPTTPAPTSPTVDTDPHSYPPMTTATTATHHITEDEPSSECLLCLSSPREVVLLPCRHLVACKECALNMVEFGAGGTIVQPESDVPAASASAAVATATETSGAGAGSPAVATDGAAESVADAGPVPATTTQRRKRKAKGWFCPVCRQPYTSLLRITTSQPSKDSSNNNDNNDSGDNVQSPPPDSDPLQTSSPISFSPIPPLSAIITRSFSSRSAVVSDLERGPDSR